MELVIWRAEVAAVQRPRLARAARSAAGTAAEAEHDRARTGKRAEARAERLHLAGLTNAGVIIMGVVLGGAVVALVLVLVSRH